LYGNNLCYSHDINFNFLHFRVIPAPFWNITFEYHHHWIIYRPRYYRCYNKKNSYKRTLSSSEYVIELSHVLQDLG
jgi:hypothetical protein